MLKRVAQHKYVLLSEAEKKMLKWSCDINKRLSYISEKGSNELMKQGLIQGSRTTRRSFYEHCVYEKSSERGEHIFKAILSYAHRDIWGPSKIAY